MMDRVKTEDWKEIFAKCKTDKGPMSRVYTEILQSNYKKIGTLEENRQRI